MAGDLEQTFERVMREEIRATLAKTPILATSHKISEFWIDPSSGEFSMSRAALGVVILGILAIDITSILSILGGTFKGEWFAPLASMNSAAVASLGVIYGANSAIGAWRRGACGGLQEKIQEWLGGSPPAPSPAPAPGPIIQPGPGPDPPAPSIGPDPGGVIFDEVVPLPIASPSKKAV